MFKQNLLRMRQPLKAATFAEALFGEVTWGQSLAKTEFNEAHKPHFSEKVQVIESLERFTQEKLNASEEPSIKVPGGEIALKPDPIWDGISSYENFEALSQDLGLPKGILELSLASKAPEAVKILFVSETFRSYDEFQSELQEGFINELLPAFPLKTAELFSRMLVAMKLTPEEVIVYPIEQNGEDSSSEVMKVAGFFQPEIIVTLGAKATHKILKGQERLAMVHGQFFNRKIENIGTFVVVPLFHPSIIENNQNMKKTAWADMQKIMKHLKKI